MQTGTDAILDQDFNIKFLKTGSKEVDKLISVFNNMIDLLRSERIRTEEQSYFLENLIKASPIGIIILDYDNNVTEINEKAIAYCELPSNKIGFSLLESNSVLLHQIAKMDVGDAKVISFHGVKKYKCQVSHVIHKGFQRKFILIEELSAEILETEKKAYGKVIRMMAHEVNNSIGAVNSVLHTIRDFVFDDNNDPDLINSLNVAIDRNDSLNQFMKNFANVIRLPAPTIQQTDIGELIEKSAYLFKASASLQSISIELPMENQSFYKLIDPIQMEQVFVNILKNAIESIVSNGVIRIEVFPSEYKVVFADNGAGILPENKGKLFSPFFSTKPTGQGIGLIIIREILVNHNIKFSLATEGEWTKFELKFP